MYIFHAVSVFHNEVPSLVFFRYRIRQNVAAGAGVDVGVSGSTQRRWGGCCCGGLLRVLQLLPGYLPLFGTSVLKPDLHLR